MSTYLLYVVPETQPPMLSRMARVYGGFHVTIFPSNVIGDEEYTIGPMMREFTALCTRYRWAPSRTFRYDSGGLSFMGIESESLRELMRWFSMKDPRWAVPLLPTEHHHLTLGDKGASHPCAQTLYNMFMHEPRWNVQLVRKTVVGGRPHYEWVQGETYPLFRP